MNETMTDEELSELAEALEDACQEIARYGGKVGASWDCFCPLGALFKPLSDSRLVIRRPASCSVPLPVPVACGFGWGFDGADFEEWWDRRAYELGQQFREKYS